MQIEKVTTDYLKGKEISHIVIKSRSVGKNKNQKTKKYALFSTQRKNQILVFINLLLILKFIYLLN